MKTPMPVKMRFSVNLASDTRNTCSADQFWEKLLLKVMHYNIALLPKTVTNYVNYFLWNVMRYVTF